MAGGRDRDGSKLLTTEVYSFKDNAWSEVGKLPHNVTGARAATINNRVLLFGNIIARL